MAASSGQPVEVLPDRTDWSQTYAEPQGGFEAKESLTPQEVQQSDGTWVPVDPTLSVRADGLVAPAAITTGLTLSDGGSGSVFTLTLDGQSLSMSWPFGDLPTPVLSGATATYTGVLPGVNLLVTALPTGVSDLIEVTSATAAANPDLAQITFPMGGTGLTVSADSQGDLTAADSTGTPYFEAPVPQMWDSAGQPSASSAPAPADHAAAAFSADDAATDPADSSPVPGDSNANMAVSATADSVSLTTVPDVLTGPSTVYPVFIDPTWMASETKTNGASWSDVDQIHVYGGSVPGNGAGAGTATLLSTSTDKDFEFVDSTTGGIRSGVTCDDSNLSSGNCVANSSADGFNTNLGDTVFRTFRSFLNFPVPSAMYGAGFADAQLQLGEAYSWNCPPPSMSMVLFDTDSNGNNVPSTTATTWANQPAVADRLDSTTITSGYFRPGQASACPGKSVFLSATAAAREANNGQWPWLTLRLSATTSDENNLQQYSWKGFTTSSMELDFYWRNAPEQPTDPLTADTFNAQTGQFQQDCGPVSAPDYTNITNPQWGATIRDNQTDQGNLDGEFNWQNVTPGVTSDSGTADADQNGPEGGVGSSPGSPFTTTFQGTAGDEYRWQVYGATLSKTDPNNVTVPVLSGPASFPWCYYWIDTGHPEAPSVTSDVFVNAIDPTAPAAGTVGELGHFTFKEPADYSQPNIGNDVVGFYYGIDSAPSTYVAASGVGGTAKIPFEAFTPSEVKVYVEAVGAGGNTSNWGGNSGTAGITEFDIKTVPAPQNVAGLGWWTLGNNGLSGLNDSTQDLTMDNGASFNCPAAVFSVPGDGYTCWLDLEQSAGSSEYVNTRPVMANDGSFSASAWVDVEGCRQAYCAIMSEGNLVDSDDGNDAASLFTMGYQPGGTVSGTPCPCWLMTMPQQNIDADEYKPGGSGNYYVVAAPAGGGVTDTWTQLTGVYDASRGQMILYVNGNTTNPAASTPGFISTPTSPQPSYFRIGADWDSTDGLQNFFDGQISDVCVFYGVLGNGLNASLPDVQNLYSKGCSKVIGDHQPTMP